MNEEELKIEIGKIKKKISKKSDKYGDWYIWNNKLEVLQAELKGIQEGKAQRDKEIKMSKKQFNEIMDKQEEFFYNQGKQQIPKGYVKLKDIEKIMDKYEYRLCKKLTFEDLKKELKEIKE